MDYLPIFLDIRDQPCLVVGGGAVAARKAGMLLRAGAKVTVQAPILCAALEAEVAALKTHATRIAELEQYMAHVAEALQRLGHSNVASR